jgi:hypothetical protein
MSIPLDAYLEIAHRVLKTTRMPLSPREILRQGLASGIVSTSLYGKTQHKTLQARLSEDILLRRERSAFFRTKPGYFFLSEFLRDPTIPGEYRIPIIARRRRRELAYPNALALDRHTAQGLCGEATIAAADILNLFKERRFHYAASSQKRSHEDIVIWAFTLVLRENLILTYRRGRYREDRDNFQQKRSIGFFSPVVHDDLTLFDQADHGIVSSGLRSLSFDLNLPNQPELARSAKLRCFICASNDDPPNILGLISFESPEWFEPLTRRLAINDLSWHDLNQTVNHFEDFDPWSRLVLEHARHGLERAESATDATPY